jgi:hypothetical protein
VQITLHIGNASVRVMKDRCRQRRIGMTLREDVAKVLEGTGAA